LRDEFRRYIAAHPDDAAGHLGLATALVNLGSTKEAIEEFKASANLDNKNPEPHKQLGALYIKQKNYSDAAKEYTRALNINPSSVPDLVALGYAYAQSEDYLQAEAALVTALALQQLTQPTSPPAGPSHYDIMRSLATLLFEEGRYAEAATHFETIVASEGSEPVTSDQFLLAEAQVLRDRSHFDALLQAFDKLSDEQKDSERMALIDTLLKNRQADLVIPILGKFIVERATPEDSARFYIEKAKASRLKSDLVKAEELDNAAIGLKDRIKEATPGVLSDAYLEMAEIAMEKNDLNVAQANAENAIETDPKSFTAYTSLGKVYLKKQNNKQALDSAKRALELNPYSARAYLLAGDALFNSGDVKEAITNYRKAIEIYPNLLEAHESLLVALKKLSNKEDVQKEADEVARLRAVQ
jgi:tetratricopeptide (TPR) repeat protein